MNEIQEKLDKYYALIDSIDELQDSGLGNSNLSKTQDYAKTEISLIYREMSELENQNSAD